MSGSVCSRPALNTALSHARRQLAEQIATVHFGRISNLKVLGGQPAFDRDTVVIRTLKIGGRNEPWGALRSPRHNGAAVATTASFKHGDALAELFRHLDELGDGTVVRLEVAHGRPLFLDVESHVQSPAGSR
jgi:hypothetical protein